MFVGRHREGVAHRQCRRARRSRHQVPATGLLVDADVEVHVGEARERRIRVAAEPDDAGAEAAYQLEQADDLLRLAGVGDGEQHVARDDHAQVAVDRLGRVHEVGGAARRGERGRDLLADDAGLAHPGDDDTAGATGDQVHRAIEVLVEPTGQRRHGLGFDIEHTARDLARATFRLVTHRHGLWIVAFNRRTA